MSKTITIQTAHQFKSGRGETETVAEALEWIEKHMSTTDEETGEESISYTPADLIVYAVRRLRALHKDNKRHDAGKLATRLYAPRLDMIDPEKASVPKALREAVESIDAVQEKLHPTPKAEPKAKKEPKAKAAKIAKAPAKAKAPKVKKAAKVQAPTGGAAKEVAF